jgi:TatD DNase family protein
MKLVDTHCHLYAEDFDSDREFAIEKAGEKGVFKIFMPNVDSDSIDGMLALEDKYPGICYPMMGLHPCNVAKGFEKELYLVEEWLNKKKFYGVGEMGIDLYWDKSTLGMQQEAFLVQAELAKKFRLPLIIHSREAFRESADLVEKVKDDNLTGIFHCFSGDKKEAERAIALGFKLGIGGVVTFKNGGLDNLLPQIDLKHIVLETDSPYLAPVPHRGKRNEPSFIALVAEKLGLFYNKSVEEIAEITTLNALNLFNVKV